MDGAEDLFDLSDLGNDTALIVEGASDRLELVVLMVNQQLDLERRHTALALALVVVGDVITTTML